MAVLVSSRDSGMYTLGLRRSRKPWQGIFSPTHGVIVLAFEDFELQNFASAFIALQI